MLVRAVAVRAALELVVDDLEPNALRRLDEPGEQFVIARAGQPLGDFGQVIAGGVGHIEHGHPPEPGEDFFVLARDLVLDLPERGAADVDAGALRGESPD